MIENDTMICIWKITAGDVLIEKNVAYRLHQPNVKGKMEIDL